MRQKELYNELTEEKKTEIKKLDNSVDRDKNKLIYKYKSDTFDVDFSDYYGAIDLINKIKDGDVSLNQAINDQYRLKSKLGDIKKGNPKRKSRTNLSVIKNVDNLYDSRQAAINFFIEYAQRASEARFRSKQNGAGNNSESLLNKIRQIVYSLYR